MFLIGLPLLFVMVTVWDALVVPTSWFPNVNDVAERVNGLLVVLAPTVELNAPVDVCPANTTDQRVSDTNSGKSLFDRKENSFRTLVSSAVNLASKLQLHLCCSLIGVAG